MASTVGEVGHWLPHLRPDSLPATSEDSIMTTAQEAGTIHEDFDKSLLQSRDEDPPIQPMTVSSMDLQQPLIQDSVWERTILSDQVQDFVEEPHSFNNIAWNSNEVDDTESSDHLDPAWGLRNITSSFA